MGRGIKKTERPVRLGTANAELLELARSGGLDLDDWDIEELIRGRRRGTDGSFKGRPPVVVPREIHDELAKRVKQDVAHQLRGIAAEYIEPVLRAVMENPGGIAPEQVPGLTLQLKAAQDLMDRFVVGRQEKVEVSGTLRHETLIQNVTIDRSLDEESDEIEDAEIVDEWDEDWDE